MTHRRMSKLESLFRGYGLGVAVACGKAYDDRKPDVDLEARGEVDCMTCIAEGGA